MKTKTPLFPNLSAELARQGLSVAALAERLGISATALYGKIRGAIQFSLREACEISEILSEHGEEITMDYLFKK